MELPLYICCGTLICISKKNKKNKHRQHMRSLAVIRNQHQRALHPDQDLAKTSDSHLPKTHVPSNGPFFSPLFWVVFVTVINSPTVFALNSKHHVFLAHLTRLGQPGFGGKPKKQNIKASYGPALYQIAVKFNL